MMAAMIGEITMDFDAIERQMLIIDLEQEYTEVLQEKQNEFIPPDWWFIGLGVKPASSPIQESKAKEIYKQFLEFCKSGQSGTMQKQVEMFIAAKTQNRI